MNTLPHHCLCRRNLHTTAFALSSPCHQIVGDATTKHHCPICSDLDLRWYDLGLTLPTSASPQQPNINEHPIPTPLLQPLLLILFSSAAASCCHATVVTRWPESTRLHLKKLNVCVWEKKRNIR
ncbi:hypothetical protein Hanom_Chr02g00127111 [Helianthus anomalus]